MEYRYKVNGKEYAVNITSVNGNKAQVLVNGTVYDVEMSDLEGAAPVVAAPVVAAPATPVAPAEKAPEVVAPAVAASQPEPAPKAEQPKPAAVPAGGTAVKAPLPGIINEIKVAVGDTVKNGQTLLVLEAMKMENEITAEQDGVVSAIAVNQGDSVMEGATLLTIA